MESRGGSELIFESVAKGVNLESLQQINLISNLAHPKVLKPGKLNVLWTQHNWNQPAMGHLRDPEHMAKFDAFIFVSNWQFDRFRNVYKVPESKSFVMPNAITPLTPKPKIKSEPLRLVYASTPWRGLEVLLDAFEMLGRDDVVLEIFSSTKIYGTEFDKANYSTYKPLFDRAKAMPNVLYHGYQPNSVVRSAFENAHILAYPSIFEETSCITAIEAGSAGLKLAVTNHGALFETCAAWASYTTFQRDFSALSRAFSKTLARVLDEYWSERVQHELTAQKQYFDYFFDMNKRISQWRSLFNELLRVH